MKVSVVKETAPGERRVALVPEAVVKLRAAGLEVLVESGAGDGAWLTDDAYAEAGASVVSRAGRAWRPTSCSWSASPTLATSPRCGRARP